MSYQFERPPAPLVFTRRGLPPTRVHTRQPQRGAHWHWPCDLRVSTCEPHVDTSNPIYDDEIWPHLRDDFLPKHGWWAIPAAAVVTVGVVGLIANALNGR